jgi:hypothetical protein
LIDVNPAKQGIDNPQRHRTEKRPFEWDELDAVAAELGPRLGPIVLFAAATGLRPANGSRSSIATFLEPSRDAGTGGSPRPR